MAEEKKRAVIAAKCPKCGQVVKFYMPEQEGVAKLKCPQPQCGHIFGVKVTPKEIRLGKGSTEQKPQQPQTSSPAPQAQSPHSVTDPIINTGTPSPSTMARLLQKRKHFYNKDKFYELRLGANTIGMHDPQLPSDIMIEGDRTISHRSVTIMVESVGRCYKYLLTVNRAKNPVCLMGKNLSEGTSLYIQPNQEFVLGKTRFCLSL